MTAPLSARMRKAALLALGGGFFLTCAELFPLRIASYEGSAAYFAYGLAAVLCFWAEKREFSTRIALYRLHDLAVYTPWKYLLLYFLWTSIFSPFTEHPWRSLLFATTGWFSLVAVGFTMYFLFCEKSERGERLIVPRIAFFFRVFCYGLLLRFFLEAMRLLWPGFPAGASQERIGTYLYFCIGMPFLIWDFMNLRRRLAPRWLSGAVLFSGSLLLLLLGRKFFLLSLAYHFIFFAAVASYKRIKILGHGVALVLLLLAAGGLALLWQHFEPVGGVILRESRNFVEGELKNNLGGVLESLKRSVYLGQGLGLTEARGVWKKVLLDAGIPGFLLYSLFFLSLARQMLLVRHSPRIVVSNVAFGSLGYFLLLASHFVKNPYGAYIWVWYSLWVIFALTHQKKEQG